jgi:hypothetical protein
MNFNFNFKDMPEAPEASMRDLTTVRDLHPMEKCGIKRGRGVPARSRMAILGEFWPSVVALQPMVKIFCCRSRGQYSPS